LIALILVLQVSLCIVLGVLSSVIYTTSKGKAIKEYFEINTNLTLKGFLMFITYFILLNTLVPITLMVSLEIVKAI